MKKKISEIVIALAVLFLIILAPLYLISFNKNFYKREFEKYSVYESFSENKSFIDNQFEDVLSHLQGKTNFPETNFYNEKEKAHLKDVKKIYALVRWILFLSVLAVLSFVLIERKDGDLILKGIKYGSVSAFIFIIILLVAVLINFEQVFVLFHKLLFNNNLWILNPETDNLIRMLPQEIFFDLSKRFILCVLSLSFLLVFGTMFLLKKVR